jgi:hypothetical protein
MPFGREADSGDSAGTSLSRAAPANGFQSIRCRERHAGGLLGSCRAKQRAPLQNRSAFHPWKPRCECSPLLAAGAENRLMAGSLTPTLFIATACRRTLTSRMGRRDGGSFAPVGELPTRHTNETAALQEYLRIDPFAS